MSRRAGPGGVGAMMSDAFWRGFVRGALIVYATGGPFIVGFFLGSWLGN